MPQEIVFCKGGGCTAKLGPDLLSHVLAKLPRGEKDSNLLVGYDSSDDGAVIFSRRWLMIRIRLDR